MKKSIMISIQPQWVEKILNGEKIIEIRKTMPKCDLPVDVYIYCSKAKHWFRVSEHIYASDETLFKTKTEIKMCNAFDPFAHDEECEVLNGKVVAKFTLNEVETLWKNNKDKTSTAHLIDRNIFEKQTCMTWEQYCEYHRCKNGKYPNSFAWYIDDLEIFDIPKELKDFNVIKAPQSWRYVTERKINKNEF